jgi:hypothetical protein
MNNSRHALTAATVLLALLLATPMIAQDNEGTGTTNVLMTFRMGTLDGNTKTVVKTYSLIVAEGSTGSKLLSGERVPFPAAGDGEAGSAIVYQNIGFSTDMRAWILDKKRIKISANIEDSSVRLGEDGGPPSVETRQLTVNAILTDGVPLELARAEGVTDNAGFVEVEAKILN